MKKYIICSLLVLVALLQTACGGKKSSVETEYEDNDWAEQAEYMNRDSTIYGVCTDGLAMHTLQILTDNGDTLTLSTAQAQETGQLYGGLAVGDHVAVLCNRERTQANMVVNLTTLMGDWVMQNPIDGGSYMGVSIRDGGVAESINQNTLIYKTWRLVNGQLEMVCIREGGGDFEETELYRLMYLSDDSLIFGNSDELYEYVRPSAQEEDYGDISDDDEMMTDGLML